MAFWESLTDNVYRFDILYKDTDNGESVMNIRICSRRAVEQLLHGRFPANTAIISFYNPSDGISTILPVDYTEVTERVFQIPLDDFQTEMLEAAELVKFIDKAVSDGLDIICQCESGQSRSAGCAAAVLEYYSHAGQAVFDDDRYRPDDMVYNAVLGAFETIL